MANPSVKITMTWPAHAMYYTEIGILSGDGSVDEGDVEFYGQLAYTHCVNWYTEVYLDHVTGSRIWNRDEVETFIRQDTPSHTGTLRGSFDFRVNDTDQSQAFDFFQGVTVVIGAFRPSYAPPVEYGAVPHTPPYQALYPWVSAKMGSGSLTGDISKATWGLQRWISKHGTKSRKMILANTVSIWSLRGDIYLPRGKGGVYSGSNAWHAGGTMHIDAETINPNGYFEGV